MHDRSAEDVLQGHVMAHHSVARGRKAPHSREGSRDVRDIEVADALRALIRKDECTSHGAEHRSRKNGCRKKRSPRSQCAELDANGASRKDSKQPDQPRTVDALVIADQMYLKDPDTMKVYSMTKDSIGDLVFIGHWNGVSIKKRRDHTSQDSLPSSLPSVAGSPLVELQTEFTVPHRRGTLQMLNFNVTDLADHCETCVEAYHGKSLVKACIELSWFKFVYGVRAYLSCCCGGDRVTARTGLAREHTGVVADVAENNAF